MSTKTAFSCLLLALSASPLGCLDQQYVSPDTVSLSITNKDTGIELVNRCNYIPILLGSEVKARYVVEDDIKATITINREKVIVSYEGSDELPEPWALSSKLFEEEVSCTQGQDDCNQDPVTLPDGFNYFVVLKSRCKIDVDE
ncbi:MAG TPA: hypothetical protein VHB79_05910 [Polyangiaceae bacterium]|nr:hypothetical protein [Polyangiaceae bacterium]